MSAGAIIAVYLLAALAVIGLVKLLVYFTTSADLGTRTDLQTPTPSEMLRALVIHSQWLYIICNLVGIPWPAAVTVPMQVIGGIWASTSGSSIGFECILRNKGVPVAVQKVLICLFTPVGVLFAVLAMEAFVQYLRSRTVPGRTETTGTTHHDFASVAMCVVFMFLPTWVNTALSLFTCIPLDKSVEPPFQAAAVGSWWVEDMSQLCYSRSGYHRRWALGLGIPLTLLFCVALPAGVFMFMWFSRKQGKLQNMQFQKHYGFMYRHVMIRPRNEPSCICRSLCSPPVEGQVVLVGGRCCSPNYLSRDGVHLWVCYGSILPDHTHDSSPCNSRHAAACCEALQVPCSQQGCCCEFVHPVLHSIFRAYLPAVQLRRHDPWSCVRKHRGCCVGAAQPGFPGRCRLEIVASG